LLVVLAPEAVPVLLGPKWTPVIVPFQILTLGMFLRTSYRISDVVTRATGAVYRRAWRQTVYMLCVIAGAWFGRRWGIAGVALGVLGALAVNYVLMAELAQRLAQLSRRHFWGAHLNALLSAVVAGGLVAGVAAALRAWGLPVGVVSRGAVSLLPTFLPLCLASRRVPWQEMKQMIRLAALQRFLARAATPRHRLIVLDEGPVFVLSWLQVFGAGRFARGASYQRWARRTLVAWAALLD